ncbi:hypothetical protein EV645_0982 [Kribbella rubisoli]|uniref:Uncharacterized protein n=1 Tax=Kribbella rubisoli TaxID=3075929 RepID=A0A4Q7X7V5_9ACTN|nr:hypothetical protein EV645_0982 [Kribbella rubisoli]
MNSTQGPTRKDAQACIRPQVPAVMPLSKGNF